eukprot:1149754-Pelagomonas_calceolata.AAC.5
MNGYFPNLCLPYRASADERPLRKIIGHLNLLQLCKKPRSTAREVLGNINMNLQNALGQSGSLHGRSLYEFWAARNHFWISFGHKVEGRGICRQGETWREGAEGREGWAAIHSSDVKHAGS